MACQWLRDGRTPRWARRHSPNGWATTLAAAADAGWTSDDINQLLHDWVNTGGNWLPPQPYKPIPLIRKIFHWHTLYNSLSDRPAAADHEREAAERAERKTRYLAAAKEREAHAKARADAITALAGSGRREAIAAARAIAQRAATRRSNERAAADRRQTEAVQNRRSQASNEG